MSSFPTQGGEGETMSTKAHTLQPLGESQRILANPATGGGANC